MSFQLSFDYPIWAFIPVIFAGLAFASILYYKNRKEHFSPWLTNLLFLLRFITVSLITFFLLDPFILQTKKQVETPTIIFAVDNSSSITLTEDSNYYRNVYPRIIDSLKNSFTDKYNIEYYQFGQKIIKNQELTFSDQQSDISEIFQTIRENYVNRNIGAILLFSDGIYNKGANPAFKAESLNIPVLTIALGDTVSHPDISIFNLRYNKKVFLKSQFTIEITIRSTQLRGKTGILELYDHDTKISERNIPITANKFSSTQYFLVDADKIGYKNLTVKIKTDVEESTLANNERQFFVEVISQKHRVLIWAKSPHPDIAALRSSLGDNFDSFVKFGKDVPGPNETYDLLILHQLPSGVNDLQLIGQLLEREKKLPVMIIVGPDTDIGAFNKLQNAVQIESGQSTDIESIPVLNETFGLFSTEFSNNEVLSKLPPLISPFGEYSKKLPDEVLFYQNIRRISTNQPMMSFVTDENRKLGFVYGTGLWRWRLALAGMKENEELFDRIINKSIIYLLQRENNDPLQIFINESYNLSDEIIVKALLYNKSSELYNDSELNIEFVNNESKSIYPFIFAQDDKGYELNAGRLPAGSYSYSAQASIAGEIMKSQGKFKIENTSLEGIDPVANHHILQQIAAQTGGKFIPLDSLQQIPIWLTAQKNITSIARYSDSYQAIINYFWALILLIGLLFIEWLFRKMYGSY